MSKRKAKRRPRKPLYRNFYNLRCQIWDSVIDIAFYDGQYESLWPSDARKLAGWLIKAAEYLESRN